MLANEPPTVADALRLVMQRLNDGGFLASALKERETAAQQDRRPPAGLQQNHQQHQGYQQPRQQGDAQGGNAAANPPRPRRPSWSRQRFALLQDQRDRPREQPREPLHDRQAPARAINQPICSRCRKARTTQSTRASPKHDVDGNTLERQEADVYARRKEQARRELAARKVNAIQQASSETEDLEDMDDSYSNNSSAHGNDDAHGCYSTLPAV